MTITCNKHEDAAKWHISDGAQGCLPGDAAQACERGVGHLVREARGGAGVAHEGQAHGHGQRAHLLAHRVATWRAVREEGIYKS